jgi:hypothetical protein
MTRLGLEKDGNCNSRSLRDDNKKATARATALQILRLAQDDKVLDLKEMDGSSKKRYLLRFGVECCC